MYAAQHKCLLMNTYSENTSQQYNSPPKKIRINLEYILNYLNASPGCVSILPFKSIILGYSSSLLALRWLTGSTY